MKLKITQVTDLTYSTNVTYYILVLITIYY